MREVRFDESPGIEERNTITKGNQLLKDNHLDFNEKSFNFSSLDALSDLYGDNEKQSDSKLNIDDLDFREFVKNQDVFNLYNEQASILENKSKAIKHAIKIEKEKIVKRATNKYKKMNAKGIFDEKTNRIRALSMMRSNFAKINPLKLQSVLMEETETNIIKEDFLMSNAYQTFKKRENPSAELVKKTLNSAGKMKKKVQVLTNMLRLQSKQEEIDKVQKASTLLFKNLTKEKKVTKTPINYKPSDFLDKLLSSTMSPAIQPSKNQFLSEEIQMNFDGMDFEEKQHIQVTSLKRKERRFSTDSSSLKSNNHELRSTKVSNSRQNLHNRVSSVIPPKKEIGIKEDKKKEIDIENEVHVTDTSVEEMTLEELMPTIDYSVADFLESIVEEVEGESLIITSDKVMPGKEIISEGKLILSSLDDFLYDNLDSSKGNLNDFQNREKRIVKEIKELRPKLLQEQKERLKRANLQEMTNNLNVDILSNASGTRGFNFLMEKSKVENLEPASYEEEKRNQRIFRICSILEQNVENLCIEIKKQKEFKLSNLITTDEKIDEKPNRYLQKIIDTMAICLKTLPVTFNERSKRTWMKAAELLIMWYLGLSSTLNIHSEKHIKRLAQYYIELFFENEQVLKQMFNTFKEKLISELTEDVDLDLQAKKTQNKKATEDSLVKKWKASTYRASLPKLDQLEGWELVSQGKKEEQEEIFKEYMSENPHIIMGTGDVEDTVDTFRQKIASIKRLLYIIVNYVNHCNSYTQDVFKELVRKEKDEFDRQTTQFKKAETLPSIKRETKTLSTKDKVTNVIEASGVKPYIKYLNNASEWRDEMSRVGMLPPDPNKSAPSGIENIEEYLLEQDKKIEGLSKFKKDVNEVIKYMREKRISYFGEEIEEPKYDPEYGQVVKEVVVNEKETTKPENFENSLLIPPFKSRKKSSMRKGSVSSNSSSIRKDVRFPNNLIEEDKNPNSKEENNKVGVLENYKFPEPHSHTKTPTKDSKDLIDQDKENVWGLKKSIFKRWTKEQRLLAKYSDDYVIEIKKDTPIEKDSDEEEERKLDLNEESDPLIVLQKLESVWDELFIPVKKKIALANKFSSSTFIDKNTSTLKRVYNLWKKGSQAIISREQILTQLKELEKKITDAKRLWKGTPVDRIQEEKKKSSLFKKLSQYSRDCEKINRMLQAEFKEDLMYQSEQQPYVVKMKNDYNDLITSFDNTKNV